MQVLPNNQQPVHHILMSVKEQQPINNKSMSVKEQQPINNNTANNNTAGSAAAASTSVFKSFITNPITLSMIVYAIIGITSRVFHVCLSDKKYEKNPSVVKSQRRLENTKFEMNATEDRKVYTLYKDARGNLYRNVKPSAIAARSWALGPKIAAYAALSTAGQAVRSVYATAASLSHPMQIFTVSNFKASASQIWRVAKPAIFGTAMLVVAAEAIVKPLAGRCHLAWLENKWHEGAAHTGFSELSVWKLLNGEQTWYCASDFQPIGRVDEKIGKKGKKQNNKWVLV